MKVIFPENNREEKKYKLLFKLLKLILSIIGCFVGFEVGWTIGQALGFTGGSSIISIMLALAGIPVGGIIGIKISNYFEQKK